MRAQSFRAIAVLALLTACAANPQATSLGSPSADAIATGRASQAADGDCPERPVDLETIMGLDRAQRLACFGADSLTFRAWVPQPFGAFGCPGDFVPGDGWLTPCDPAGVAVVPDPVGRADAPPEALGLHLHPQSDVGREDFRANTFVQVTGHFDDPASRACARLAPNGQPVEDPAAVMECRLEFVVTDVGPAT